MKAFNRIFAAVIAIFAVLALAVNLILLTDKDEKERPYRVEINRLADEIELSGFENVSATGCQYVTEIQKYGEDFFSSDSDYVIREIKGELYRFDYRTDSSAQRTSLIITANVFILFMPAVIAGVLLYIKFNILLPFEQLSDIPYQLSKGNLTAPLKESKNRFFGRFIWGVDMLRENIEQQKARELELQREKKMLLLSLSHDIKTPLSAIKLYSKALSKGIYEDREKQISIADSIDAKADEIESYVSQIITASREDFLGLDVREGEFYLSELVRSIADYYGEKLALVKTEFVVGDFKNCLLSGDFERSVEVLQNIIENAVKYGDGNRIELIFSEEEESDILITVKNSGCTLDDSALPRIFESFWRGENAASISGSGLGLYICRQLMRKMKGEVFAEIKDGFMCVTAVFSKA